MGGRNRGPPTRCMRQFRDPHRPNKDQHTPPCTLDDPWPRWSLVIDPVPLRLFVWCRVLAEGLPLPVGWTVEVGNQASIHIYIDVYNVRVYLSMYKVSFLKGS